MRYDRVISGTFLSRPNRFIAHVDIGGTDTVCHVKNTGRCKELLIPGCQVILSISSNPLRKTGYDLIAVRKGERLINMDSQAPNAAAEEYLRKVYPNARITRERTHGDSRFDLCIEENGRTLFVEVKGVTLEKDGAVLFPDAPTQRGTKHLRGLKKCVEEGLDAMVLFVAQMQDVRIFRPNEATDPAFAHALRDARDAGVGVQCVWCRVTETTMEIAGEVPVCL